MNKISTRITFVVLTALLVGGFPNFMAQEAFAANAAIQTRHSGDTAGDSTATTTIDLVFDLKVYVDGEAADGVAVDKQALFQLNGEAAGVGITSANILDEETATPGDMVIVGLMQLLL